MIENIPDSSSGRRLSGLQGARGLAAISVVIAHALYHPMKEQVGVAGFPGTYGVTLFFLISGLIMVRTTGAGAFNPIHFLVRRIKRIVPLYYIACAMLALAAAIVPYSFRSTVLDPVHIIKSLLFIPDYAPRAPGEIFPFFKLGWTLNLEMFFYLTFAALAALDVRLRISIISVFFIGLVLWGANYQIPYAAPKFYTMSILPAFGVGMALGLVDMKRTQRLTKRAAYALVGISVVSLAAAAANYDMLHTHNVLYNLWIIVSVALQLAVVAFYVDRGGVKVPKVAIVAGDASYSIYLFHMFAIASVFAVAQKLFPGAVALGVLAAAIGGVLIGLMMHYLVEVPIIKWLGSPFSARPKRPAQAAGGQVKVIREPT